LLKKSSQVISKTIAPVKQIAKDAGKELKTQAIQAVKDTSSELKTQTNQTLRDLKTQAIQNTTNYINQIGPEESIQQLQETEEYEQLQ
jgi:ElaB/YqjD/DUF883 family membrane-anchored ribosome-binding protein